MESTKFALSETLKSAGYSETKVRRTVFNLLNGREPQTMAEIIQRSDGKIDRASIYRTIELFEKLDIVKKLRIGWKYKLELTDRFIHHHHHMACINCGRVIPIKEDVALEMMIHAVSKQAGFEPTTHELEIRGLCEKCQKLTGKFSTDENPTPEYPLHTIYIRE